MDKATKRRVIQITTVAATLLIVVMLIGLIANLVSMAKLSSRKNFLADQLSALEQQSQELEGMIDYRGSDSYIERYAREQLGMVGSGEIVYKPNN